MNLKYGDRVKVISGFYEGQVGTVRGAKGSGSAHPNEDRYQRLYELKLDTTGDITEWIYETRLEPFVEFARIV